MENLPFYISFVFIITTLLIVIVFYKATNNHKNTLLIVIVWLVFQCIFGLTGFYTFTNTIPPRFLLLILPPVFLISVLFTTQKGRLYIDRIDTKLLSLLHTARILVEIVLFWLATYKVVPVLMTFEGRNFDILAGLTAPLIFYFGYHKQLLSAKILLIWNIIGIALLLNIVIHGILSVPSAFQKFAFEQPNIALMYFPFNWLPSFVVPVVLFSHLVTIRKIITQEKKDYTN